VTQCHGDHKKGNNIDRPDKQVLKLTCAAELVKGRYRPSDLEPAIRLNIANQSLGHVYFDTRYDDQKFWIFEDFFSRKLMRFSDRKEAVDAMLSAFGVDVSVSDYYEFFAS